MPKILEVVALQLNADMDIEFMNAIREGDYINPYSTMSIHWKLFLILSVVNLTIFGTRLSPLITVLTGSYLLKHLMTILIVGMSFYSQRYIHVLGCIACCDTS